MYSLENLGIDIAAKRKSLKLSQTALAKKASISRATLDALENGRIRELGYSRINRILSALHLEFRLQEANAQRPTFEELLGEEQHDQGLDQQR